MLYNIKPLHLHCVFHGIRFKVNKDWLSGIDSLLFFIYLLAIPLFIIYSSPFFTFMRFLLINLLTQSTKILYLHLLFNVKRKTHKLEKS